VNLSHQFPHLELEHFFHFEDGRKVLTQHHLFAYLLATMIAQIQEFGLLGVYLKQFAY